MKVKTFAVAATATVLAGCATVGVQSPSETQSATSTAPAANSSFWRLGGAFTGPWPPVQSPPAQWSSRTLGTYIDSSGYRWRFTAAFGPALHYAIPSAGSDCYSAEQASFQRDLPPGQYAVPFMLSARNLIDQQAQWGGGPLLEAADPNDSSNSAFNLDPTGTAGSTMTWADGKCVGDVSKVLGPQQTAISYGLIEGTTAQLQHAVIYVHWTNAEDLDPSYKADWSAPLATLVPGRVLPGSTPTVRSTSATCPTLQFFGVRGSGEKASDGNGYGSTVQGFELTLAALEHGLSATPIDYPAIPVGYALQDYGASYQSSVAAGENVLQTALTIFWSKCPNTYVMLAGYSQGAQVAADVADTLPLAQRTHIAAVALFGDPRFNPHQSKVDIPLTGYDPRFRGIYQWVDKHMRQVPPDLEPRMQSYCLKGDVVCNYSKANLLECSQVSQCQHLFYLDRDWVTKAAYWAASLLRHLPKL